MQGNRAVGVAEVTDDELAAFVELAEAVTRGPWYWYRENEDEGTVYVPEAMADDGMYYIATTHASPTQFKDAEFIAAARNQAPAIARELLEARALPQRRRKGHGNG